MCVDPPVEACPGALFLIRLSFLNTELHFEPVIIVTPTLDLDGKPDTGLADNGSQCMLVIILDPCTDYTQSTIAPPK